MRLLQITALAACAGFAAAKLVLPDPEAATEAQVLRPAASTSPARMIAVESKPAAVIAETWADRLGLHLQDETEFRQAARLQKLVASLTLDDLRSMLRDPALEGDERLAVKPPSIATERVFEAIVARWLELDDKAALEIWEDDKTKGQVFRPAVAKMRPRVVLDKMPADIGVLAFFEAFYIPLVALTEADSTSARRYADHIRDSELRAHAHGLINVRIAAIDPLAGVALAHADNDATVFGHALAAAAESNRGLLREVLTAGAGKFRIPLELRNLVFQYPDETWPELAIDELNSYPMHALSGADCVQARRLSHEERLALLNDPSRGPAGTQEDSRGLLLCAWVHEDPVAAMDWAWTHGTSSNLTSMESAFRTWTRLDQPVALDWLQQQPASPARTRLVHNVAQEFALRGELDAAINVFREFKETPVNPAAREIYSGLTQQDPAKAATWYAALPEGSIPDLQSESLMQAWMRRNPDTATQWLTSLAPGLMRNQAILGFCRAVIFDDPTAAGAWLAEIDSPVNRNRAIEQCFEDLERTDPRGAREWLHSLGGLPKDWAARFLRQHSP